MNNFIPIHEPHTNWLLFRYDPIRRIVEVQRRGVKTLVDLTQYDKPEPSLGDIISGSRILDRQ